LQEKDERLAELEAVLARQQQWQQHEQQQQQQQVCRESEILT